MTENTLQFGGLGAKGGRTMKRTDLDRIEQAIAEEQLEPQDLLALVAEIKRLQIVNALLRTSAQNYQLQAGELEDSNSRLRELVIANG